MNDESKTVISDPETPATTPPGDVPVEARALAVGTRVGRYVIVGELGQGGMGTVYAAYDPEVDRRIALKVMSLPGEARSGKLDRGRGRLLREAQALGKLSHRNVVGVYDVGAFGDSVFVAMELLSGLTYREWMDDRDPSRAEILQTLLEAGTGLAAAHRAGIVHRDFKPENVIVTAEGRVCVIDFGLARGMGAPSAEIEGSDSDSDSSCQRKLLEIPLTENGRVVGTLGYMAPEQLLHGDVDERSDQFSFCVTLFEALAGHRPYLGQSRRALQRNILQGHLRAPSASRPIPEWLLAILRRGLSADRQARYPSMDALLEALTQDPDQKRLRTRAAQKKLGLGVLAGLLLGAGLFLSWDRWESRRRICQGGLEKLAGVWDPATKNQLAQAFLATGLGYAEDTTVRVTRALDAHAADFVGMYQEACERTRIHADQSERLLDLRMGCLHERLTDLKALTEVLRQADRRIVENAVAAVAQLSTFERCADAQALLSQRGQGSPLDDLARRSGIEAIRQKTAQAKALLDAGKYEEGLTRMKEVVPAARTLAHPKTAAESLFIQALLNQQMGDLEAAARGMREAFALAEAAGDDLQRVGVAIELIHVTGYAQGHVEEGKLWAQIGEGILARLGENDKARARWQNNLGQAFLPLARVPEALECLHRSVAIYDRSLPPDHLKRAFTLLGLGEAHRVQGRFDLALQSLNQALQIRTKALGPMHPDVAEIQERLGDVWLSRNDLVQARARYERNLEIVEKSSGPTTFWYQQGSVKLARVLFLLGERAAAQRRVSAIVEQSAGDRADPRLQGESRFLLAQILWETPGERPEACELAYRARSALSTRSSLLGKSAEIEGWLKSRKPPCP